MLIDVQRAPVAAVVISMAMYFLYALWIRPRRAAVMAVVLGGVLAVGAGRGGEIGQEMAMKTARVGVNMRWHELMAVIESLSQSGFDFIFGLGWGAQFSAPSVGGVHISYTHSFLSYLLFKGGLLGLCLGLFLCWGIVKGIYNCGKGDVVRGLSLFWVFVIPVLFYASHKSLDFGLALLFISVWIAEDRGLICAGQSCNFTHQQQSNVRKPLCGDIV